MGMADIVTMKENDTVALKDVLDDLDIKHDDAVEFLKRVGFPVWREGEQISRQQYYILIKELSRYKNYFKPNHECHNCHKQFDNIGPKYECGKCGHVFCADCVIPSDSMLAYHYPSLNGKVLCRECAEKEAIRMQKAAKELMEEKRVIGINNNKVESIDELKARLNEIAKMPTEHTHFDGAMCYCPAFPKGRITITHKCPNCGKKHKYEGDDYGGLRLGKYDRYKEDELFLDKIVKGIRELGYDAKIKHMCHECYHNEFNDTRSGISVSVLYFKNIGEEKYRCTVVDSDDCKALLEFLRGNNAFRGHYDESVWIKGYMNKIEEILGIER